MSSLEVVRRKVASGTLLQIVGLLVADESHQVRRLEVAGAALEDVGATAFGRRTLHHLVTVMIWFGFVTFKQLSTRVQKNAPSATRIQNQQEETLAMLNKPA